MKPLHLAVLTVALGVFSSASLRAVTPPMARIPVGREVAASHLQTVGFGDTEEAGMLHRAYHILASGDHDYDGHRVRAMRAVKEAAEKLGLDLRGDDRDREKQVLSDDRLREADGLLQRVLASPEVSGQKQIAKHIHAAIKEIREALRAR